MSLDTDEASGVDCCHCGKTGTCRNAEQGASCERCIAVCRKGIWRFTKKDSYWGLVCSVCHGKGLAEPMALKWSSRFPFVLATILVLLAFLLLFLGNVVGLSPRDALPFVGT